MLLADDNSVQQLFGTIVPTQGMLGVGGNPQTVISELLGKGLQLIITGASLVMLAFLLWGALDWILSGGEKEKISKAQSKITNAILGFIIMFVMLAVFGVITGDILGIVKKNASGGWIFSLPTLHGTDGTEEPTSTPAPDPGHGGGGGT